MYDVALWGNTEKNVALSLWPVGHLCSWLSSLDSQNVFYTYKVFKASQGISFNLDKAVIVLCSVKRILYNFF